MWPSAPAIVHIGQSMRKINLCRACKSPYLCGGIVKTDFDYEEKSSLHGIVHPAPAGGPDGLRRQGVRRAGGGLRRQGGHRPRLGPGPRAAVSRPRGAGDGGECVVQGARPPAEGVRQGGRRGARRTAAGGAGPHGLRDTAAGHGGRVRAGEGRRREGDGPLP